MKTQIITLFAALVLSTGIETTTFAATTKTENLTVLTDIGTVNKIEVHGNVELYISDGAKDQVKVYNKYYAEGALVQNKNGVLCISNYTTEKLVVWVAANGLSSVAAYDNAEINTFGKLSKIEFNVDLYDNATAKLNLDSYSANVSVNGNAKAYLTGNVNEYSLKYNHAENVYHTDFAAQHESKTITGRTVIAKVDELVDLVD